MTTDATPVTLETKATFKDVAVSPTGTVKISFGIDGRNSSAIQSVIFSSTSVPSVNAKCVYLTPSGRIAVKTDSDRNSANGCN